MYMSMKKGLPLTNKTQDCKSTGHTEGFFPSFNDWLSVIIEHNGKALSSFYTIPILNNVFPIETLEGDRFGQLLASWVHPIKVWA